MQRQKRSFVRPEAKYFDRNLSREILIFYPEFRENKISKEFKNQIFIDTLVDETEDDNSNIRNKLREIGISYTMIAYYIMIDKEDLILFKLLNDISDYNVYSGEEIGQYLLNEINDFNL